MISFDTSASFTLEDERVLLRPLEISDTELLAPLSLEKEIWKYASIDVYDADSLRNYFQLALDGRAAQKEYPFVVYDKLKEKYAGSTRFYDIQPANRMLQLGYTWYGKEFHGTGLNKHCKFLLLQFAFEKIGMERVEFRANNQNERSIAAMKSIGCTVEGVLRKNMWKADGSYRDSIILSILKEEWLGGVKEQLKAKLS